MINLVGAAEKAAIEAEKALQQAAIDKDAAGAAFDEAFAIKTLPAQRSMKPLR